MHVFARKGTVKLNDTPNINMFRQVKVNERNNNVEAIYICDSEENILSVNSDSVVAVKGCVSYTISVLPIRSLWMEFTHDQCI